MGEGVCCWEKQSQGILTLGSCTRKPLGMAAGTSSTNSACGFKALELNLIKSLISVMVSYELLTA